MAELHDDKKAMETKIVDLTRQLSEASTGFEHLKEQHIKMVETMAESDQTVNAKQREIEELKDELGFAQAQVRLKVYYSKPCPHVSVVMCIGPYLPGGL